MAQIYVKVLSETNISTDVPKTAIIDGKFACGRLPESYLNSIEFYRLVEQDPPETVEEGYHLEKRYAVVNNEAVQSWVAVENDPGMQAPKQYSKLKILLAAQNAGMDEAFVGVLQSNATLKLIWDASNTIEDNALLDQYLPAIAESLERTTEELKAFLNENCQVD